MVSVTGMPGAGEPSPLIARPRIATPPVNGMSLPGSTHRIGTPTVASKFPRTSVTPARVKERGRIALMPFRRFRYATRPPGCTLTEFAPLSPSSV